MINHRACDPATDRRIGEVLAGRYVIDAPLGRGATGAVYKARHIKLGRWFAVKMLHPQFSGDAKLARRFDQEAELAARLCHPNVVSVVDVGTTHDGLRYMVMDHVDGEELEQLLRTAPLRPRRIIQLTRQLLDGLYHAHQAGLIHRDFKPSNVIVQCNDHGDEVPRIIDFGIAIVREAGGTDGEGRLTTNGLVLGTPHYMAPEQATASSLDHRCDLFALGIVVYQMLSGRMPFDGSGSHVAQANTQRDPPPIAERVPDLEVDPLLEAFARKLMHRSRDRRPTCASSARALLDLVEHDPEAAALALGVSARLAPSISEPLPRAVTAVPHEAPPMRRPQIALPARAPSDVDSGPSDTIKMPARVTSTMPERACTERDIATARTRRLAWRYSQLVAFAGLCLLAVVGAVAIRVRAAEPPPRAVVREAALPVEAAPPPLPLPAPGPPMAGREVTVPTVQAAAAEPPAGAGRLPIARTQPRERLPEVAAHRPREVTASPGLPTEADPGTSTPAPGPSVLAPPLAAPVAQVPHMPLPIPRAPAGPGATAPARVGPEPGMTAAALAHLYTEVGVELRSLQHSHGSAATDDLWIAYRMLDVAAAMRGSPAQLGEAAAGLSRLRATAVRRRRTIDCR